MSARGLEALACQGAPEGNAEALRSLGPSFGRLSKTELEFIDVDPLLKSTPGHFRGGFP